MDILFFPVESILSAVPIGMGLVYKLNEEDIDNYAMNINKNFRDETDHDDRKQMKLYDFNYDLALKEQLKNKGE